MKISNTFWLIALMILIPIVAYMFNFFALFLFIPLGFLFKKKN